MNEPVESITKKEEELMTVFVRLMIKRAKEEIAKGTIRGVNKNE